MRRASGFGGFSVLWAGQMLSAVGTRMTNFAVGIWLWEQTHSATDVALLAFAAFGATILFSPLAGALVDRWNRRMTIVVADVGSLGVTGALLAVYQFGTPHVWMLYVVNFATGAFLAFQGPAYGATITTMMDKQHYSRANAMMGLLRAAPYVAAPAVAAPLVSAVGLTPVLAVDTASYLAAIAAVFAVVLPSMRAPEPSVGADPQDGPGRVRVWADTKMAFGYIKARPPLVGLLFIMFFISFLSALGWVLFSPMVLARTDDDATAVGIVQVVGAIGGTVAGIWLAALKPTPHKMRRMLIAILVLGLPGRLLFGFDGIWVWSVALFFGWGAIPFIDGYNQTIWQEKIPPAIQGRVLATVQIAENIALPIAYLTAGTLADHYLEPNMMPGGSLTHVFGPITGTGPGAGIAVLFVLSGAAAALLAVIGFLTPTIRDAETLLPDYLPSFESGGTAAESEPTDAEPARSDG